MIEIATRKFISKIFFIKNVTHILKIYSNPLIWSLFQYSFPLTEDLLRAEFQPTPPPRHRRSGSRSSDVSDSSSIFGKKTSVKVIN